MWWDFDDYAEMEAVFPGSVFGTFNIECNNCGKEIEIEAGGDLIVCTETNCPYCKQKIIYTA